MKFPSLETVRLLKPRLGFGPVEVCVDPDVGGAAAPETAVLETAEPVVEAGVENRPEVIEAAEESPVSLVHLAEQLELAAAEPEPAAMEPEPEAGAVEAPAPSGPLVGRKVAAIGFGRQDIAGLATAMLEERARIEFLPHGGVTDPGEFDLFLLNCSSVEVLKRDAKAFRAVLDSGVPAVVVGSRAALSMLRAQGQPRSWDFAAKPLHMDELVWRAGSLVARCEDSGVPRVLPRRVVVADHDPFARTLIESALSNHGFACELAEDGESAWKAVEKTEPGVLVLDLTLPNRDGFQLLADVRRMNGRKPKVVVLSARQSEADILRAFALGADDYITKPFSPLELNARLNRLVGAGDEHG